MKKIPKNLVVVSFLAIFTIGVFFLLERRDVRIPESLAEYLGTKGLSFQYGNEFIIDEVETIQITDIEVTKISARYNDIVVHVELVGHMGEKQAQTYIKNKKVGIESLFLPSPVHYPGVITQTVRCPDEFKPIFGVRGSLDYYILYASARFSYGVCSPGEVKYKSVVGFLYCPERDIFTEIKLFSSPEFFTEKDALDLLQSTRCG